MVGVLTIRADIAGNPKTDTYYIYCQRGVQSRKLCLILKNMGYKVVNINGGYEAWILE